MPAREAQAPGAILPDFPSHGLWAVLIALSWEEMLVPWGEAAHFPKATPTPSLRKGLRVPAFVVDEIGTHSFLTPSHYWFS